MSLKTRLLQQQVSRETRLGPTMVNVPQMQIFVTLDNNPEVMVGYVGNQKDAPINLIYPDLSIDHVDEIEKQVRRIREESLAASQIATPPTSEQLAELAPVFPDEEQTEHLEEDDLEG